MAITILSLPEELLTAVFDAITEISASDLKDLRTVCKAFAGNYSILRRQFSHVFLPADVTWFDKRNTADIVPFTSFVEAITFLPPLYNWHMHLDLFQEILQESYEHLDGPYAPIHWADGDPTFPTTKHVRPAYDIYYERGSRNQSLLRVAEGAILVSRWSRLLKHFSKCYTFAFGFVRYGLLDEHLEPDYPACAQEAYVQPPDMTLNDPATNLAGLTFGIALAALARNRNKIETIELKAPIQPGSLWSQNLRLDLLQLGSLKHFSFRPGIFDNTNEDEVSDSDALFIDLAYLIEKCDTTLETIETWDCGMMSWPNEFRLPTSLRSLDLGPGEILSRLLASWIRSCPKLDTMNLSGVGTVSENGNRSWKQIYDAIRDHKVPLHLKLDCYNDDGGDFSLNAHVIHHPGNTPEASEDELDDEAQDTERQQLIMYLDGRIDWTERLEEIFGDY